MIRARTLGVVFVLWSLGPVSVRSARLQPYHETRRRREIVGRQTARPDG
jgi:hypothetical protein